MRNSLFFTIQYIRIICYCIIGATLIRVIYMGIKHRNSLSRLFMIMYFISSILSGIFVISGITTNIMELLDQYNKYFNMGTYINTMAIYFYYYLFICQIYMKLNAAFKGSIYSISKRKQTIIISSLLIIIIFELLSITLAVMVSLSVALLFVIPSWILYNFISIYMVYTFISTLIRLINNTNGPSNNPKMIKTVVIYINTSIIAYASTIVLLGLCILLVQWNSYIQIGFSLPIIDGFIGLIALYFQYNFAENDYDKCCTLCHKFILHCLYAKTNKVSINSDTNNIETCIKDSKNINVL